MFPDIVYVLGGGLVCEKGEWRTTHFDEEGDAFGALGDRLRVEAAFILSKNYPSSRIVLSGGKGQLRDNPDAPTIASVLRKELIELGVREARILEESASNNTYEQLRHLVELCAKYGWKNVKILTNAWHIPRTSAFLEVSEELTSLNDIVEVISAESVLVSHDQERWELSIFIAYGTDAMKERYAKEEEGIVAIKGGTYMFK